MPAAPHPASEPAPRGQPALAGSAVNGRSMYCKQCKYNLRGLVTPRCPECGTGFDPTDSSTFAAHPYAPWRVAVARAFWWCDAWWFWSVGLAIFAVLMVFAVDWWQRAHYGLFVMLYGYLLLRRLFCGRPPYPFHEGWDQ